MSLHRCRDQKESSIDEEAANRPWSRVQIAKLGKDQLAYSFNE